jgi:hypothetical protein
MKKFASNGESERAMRQLDFGLTTEAACGAAVVVRLEVAG